MDLQLLELLINIVDLFNQLPGVADWLQRLKKVESLKP